MEKVYIDIISSFTRLNQSRSDIIRSVAIKAIKPLVIPEGQEQEGSFILDSLARSEDYSVKRIAKVVVQIAKDVGVTFSTSGEMGEQTPIHVVKFTFPEGCDSWEDIETRIMAWRDPVEVEKYRVKTDEEIAEEAQAKKEKNRINLRTKDGAKKFAHKVIKVSENLERNNSCKDGAKLMRLVALNPNTFLKLYSDAQKAGVKFNLDLKEL